MQKLYELLGTENSRDSTAMYKVKYVLIETAMQFYSFNKKDMKFIRSEALEFPRFDHNTRSRI